MAPRPPPSCPLSAEAPATPGPGARAQVSAYRAPGAGEPRCGAELLNLHHDRNCARPRRCATAVMYLNSCPAGGGTFFPCAEAPGSAAPPAALSADLAQVYLADPGAVLPGPLLDGSSAHPAEPRAEHAAAAAAAAERALRAAEAACAAARQELESSGAPWCFGSLGGLLVRPVKVCLTRLPGDPCCAAAELAKWAQGAAVVFWSVDAAGAAEVSAAWHGAVNVFDLGPKLAAQKFKEAVLPAE